MKRNILLIAALSVAGTLFVGSPLRAADVAPPTTQPASSDAPALIQQLGNDDFHVRQSASEALRKMGKAARPALEVARKSSDPEIHARADELLQDLDTPPAQPVPQPSGAGNTHSMRMSVGNGVKTIDVIEPGRTIHIEENTDGITMKVAGQLNGKEVTRDYKAKTADQLKKENPDAFALYQQHNGSGGAVGQFQIQGGGGIIIHGNINVQGGAGNIIIGPNVNPQLIQPLIPLKPANPSGDDLEQLESKILEQMKTGNIPDAQQEQVKGLLKQLREARPSADKAGKDAETQMREYNERSDAVRKELSDLKLPDPGDALPPPSWGRLGISAQEETVGGQGLVVTHVLPDSRAEKIGLKEQDVIQKVNGQDIHSTKELRKAVTDHAQDLVIEGMRDGKPMKLEEPAAK